jgi:opacity protein-like surface antigen
VEEFSGWYLRGDVGWGVAENPVLENYPDPIASGVSSGALSSNAAEAFNNTTLSPFGMVDVGLGYRFNPWLRVDGTLEYRGGSQLQSLYTLTDVNNPLYGGPTQFADFYRANLSSVVGLLNGYVNLPTAWGVSPFVGAGIGFADNNLSGFTDQGIAYSPFGPLAPSGGYFSNGTKTNFAWTLIAGLDFDILPNLKLEASYRYLNYGKIASGASNCLGGGFGGVFNAASCGIGVANSVRSANTLASNDFRLGLIWLLGAPAPASGGVVARY